ncbi:MAG: hypothetical protein RB191_14980 [Terriglobia bacterium]|nr:hypothetical protein [Terriglobia bacterium]
MEEALLWFFVRRAVSMMPMLHSGEQVAPEYVMQGVFQQVLPAPAKPTLERT